MVKANRVSLAVILSRPLWLISFHLNNLMFEPSIISGRDPLQYKGMVLEHV